MFPLHHGPKSRADIALSQHLTFLLSYSNVFVEWIYWYPRFLISNILILGHVTFLHVSHKWTTA